MIFPCDALLTSVKKDQLVYLLCDQLQDQVLDIDLLCHLMLLWSTHIRVKGPGK